MLPGVSAYPFSQTVLGIVARRNVNGMPWRRRKREKERPEPAVPVPTAGARPPDEIVRLYLRGQNLEQMRRVEEAAEMYEEAVTNRFDAAGPYDRLIAIYLGRNDHAAVRRVAEAALASVRTFDDKRAWYESVRSGATEAEKVQPDRRGAEF
jgi:hypothetical protein